MTSGPSNPRRRSKPVIGLAGGIGSGKSLVARQLESMGCGVIDADALSRQMMERSDVRERLVRWWGAGVLDAGGGVDRKAVAARVFDRSEELGKLEGLIHPLVNARRMELRGQLNANDAVVAIVEDCPLLYEMGINLECDRVIFVRASRQNRLARLKAARGWTETDLAAREKNQLELDTKAKRADYVVENNQGEAECLAHVRSILSQILHDRPRNGPQEAPDGA